MSKARLHDGKSIELEISGAGPNLLLPVRPQPIEGVQAEQMRQYGTDPALGRSLIQGLNDIFRVIAFDYEGHVLKFPKAATLTPENAVADLLAVADAAGAERFAYYGYSWLAVIGLQLAIRSKRLTALALGGYPPLNGPYKEMLQVTLASNRLANLPQTAQPDDEWSGNALSDAQTRQFVTLYQELQSFDDRAAQAEITCPHLCFVGSADEIQYDKSWGDVLVSLAGPVVRGQSELQAFGWEVHILDGLNHMQAMQAPQVLPILRPWLTSQLVSR